MMIFRNLSFPLSVCPYVRFAQWEKFWVKLSSAYTQLCWNFIVVFPFNDKTQLCLLKSFWKLFRTVLGSIFRFIRFFRFLCRSKNAHVFLSFFLDRFWSNLMIKTGNVVNGYVFTTLSYFWSNSDLSCATGSVLPLEMMSSGLPW